MFLSALLGLAVFTDAISPDNNGIYVSAEGYVFTVLNPHTIWTTMGRRYHSAFGLEKTSDTGYQGKYDASNVMNPGYNPDPQVKAQYDLLNDVSSTLNQSLVPTPLAIPCVPAPDASATGDFGTVKVDQTPGKPSLHFSWKYANGNNDYSGDATKIGGPELIDLDGVYSDALGSITISEQGSGAAKALVGSATVDNKKYRLSGLRIWGRGIFQIKQEGASNPAGTGWLEWAPSRAFAKQLTAGKTTPSDRIRIFIDNGNGPVSPSTIRILSRTSD